MKKESERKIMSDRNLVLGLLMISFVVLGVLIFLYFGFYDDKIDEHSLKNVGGLNTLSPSNTEVYVFPNQTKRFEIINQEYNLLEWYLDENLTDVNNSFYDFKVWEEGEYVLKVKIGNESGVYFRDWNIIVRGDEYIELPRFDRREVIFYVVIIVMVIIMFLIVWLFIIEKNRA